MLWGHCPFPHPRPGSPNSRPGESRARLAPGPVTHPKPVPVPAGPDSARAFPRAHLGPLVSRPCPHSPSSRDPDGAAGRQFLPRELWGGARGHPGVPGSLPVPIEGCSDCVRAADGDTAHGPQKTPRGAWGPPNLRLLPWWGCWLQLCSLSRLWVSLGTLGTVLGSLHGAAPSPCGHSPGLPVL